MAADELTLLSLWEQGQRRAPLDRALLLLWGCAGAAEGELAHWPLGRRDAALIDARVRLFGPVLDATADCPACAARMAFTLRLDELAQQLPAAAGDVIVACNAGRFRLPHSADLAAALGASEPRRALALRLRVAGELPLDDEQLAVVEAALADADPAAQIDIALACDACGSAFDAPLDIAECLWLDVSRRAQQTLDDVHQLASAYGWSEAEVLAVPPARRQHYLQRVGV
jgi:hypothetical protein